MSERRGFVVARVRAGDGGIELTGEKRPEKLLTVAQAAALLNITPGAWRSLVSSGYAPPPDDRGDLDVPANRRSPKWLESTVIRHRDTRASTRWKRKEAR